MTTSIKPDYIFAKRNYLHSAMRPNQLACSARNQDDNVLDTKMTSTLFSAMRPRRLKGGRDGRSVAGRVTHILSLERVKCPLSILGKVTLPA